MCNTENKKCPRGEFKNVILRNIMETNNVFVSSPISTEIVLLLAYLGSNGSTKEAFERVLRIDESLIDDRQELMNDFEKIKNITGIIANKIYIKKGFGVKPEYVSEVKKFMGEIEEIDFDFEGCRSMNKWVENKTKSKIVELVKDEMLGAEMKLVLLNVVYFKGNWVKMFDPSKTHKSEFNLSNGTTKVVDMMLMQMENFGTAYVRELDSDVLEMKYVGDEFSMIIVLPRKNDGIRQLKKVITSYDLTSFEMNEIEMDVCIPKFTIESEFDLGDVLKKIGLDVIFGSADFSGISDEKDLSVGRVVQKVFIEVDEEGTQAAGVTAGMLRFMSLPPSFIADHEFIFAIKYNNVILFQGSYA